MTTMTAKDIADALDRRYGQNQQGTQGEAWVTLREARSGAGFQGNNRQCDYLAINTWQSRGLQVVGHEIKVSRSDWKRELADPDKAETFARYCRRWWVVMPLKLANEVRDEVPPAWGLIAVSEKSTRELVPAPAREPEIIPPWWWVGWLAQIDRRQRRGDAAERQAAISAEVAAMRPTIEEQVRREIERGRNAHVQLFEQVKAFERATGINVAHGWTGNFEELGRLWKMVQSGGVRFDMLAKQLQRTADALAELSGAQSA